MVQELYEMIDDLKKEEQKVFVFDLFNNLDPYMPFLEQQSEESEKWLYSLYEKYVNGDEEAAKEYYED